MTNFVNWISPDVLRTLGWTLLHFLWQGAGLAALFALGAAVCRSAPARYALAGSTLGFVMGSPGGTFTRVPRPTDAGGGTGAGGTLTWGGTRNRKATARARAP